MSVFLRSSQSISEGKSKKVLRMIWLISAFEYPKVLSFLDSLFILYISDRATEEENIPSLGACMLLFIIYLYTRLS
jgi:hypothetical protein